MVQDDSKKHRMKSYCRRAHLSELATMQPVPISSSFGRENGFSSNVARDISDICSYKKTTVKINDLSLWLTTVKDSFKSKLTNQTTRFAKLRTFVNAGNPNILH